MRKNELDKLSQSYARSHARANSHTNTDLAAKAKASLAAVNDVYGAAADATDQLRTLLAQPGLSPKDILQLTSALRNISSVLVEARAEARTTVADLSAAPAAAADPPAPNERALVDAVHDTMTNFSPPANSGKILPDTAADAAEDPRYVDDVNGRDADGYQKLTADDAHKLMAMLPKKR